MENFNYTATFTVEVSVNEVANKLYSQLDNRKGEEYRTRLVATIIENCLTNNGSLGLLYDALKTTKTTKAKSQIDLRKNEQMH